MNPVVIPWRTRSQEASSSLDVLKTGWLSKSRSFSSISLIACSEEANGWNWRLGNTKGMTPRDQMPSLCLHLSENILPVFSVKNLEQNISNQLLNWWKRKVIISLFFSIITHSEKNVLA